MTQPPDLFVTCRPVDWSRTAGHLPAHPEPAVYIGSVMDRCATCSMQIWVSPLQQHLRSHANALVICYLCGIAAAAGSTTAKVIDLGKAQGGNS